MKYSKYQENIFSAIKDTDKSYVIEAVAGSGKTSTIIKSLEYVSSFSKAMFIAFNKSIVRELNGKLPEHVPASTWHSLGFKNIIRTFGKVKVDESKTYNIFKSLKGEYGTWAGINRLVSLAKAEGEENPNFSEIFNSYGIVIEADKINYSFLMADRIFKESLKDTQTVDFDDMLLFNAVGYINSFETFTHLFVDEGQDTNNAQIKMLLSSLGDTGRAIVVGDRKQSIYRFRGADSLAMDRILTEINGENLPLSICYRCGKKIVNLAKTLVPQIEPFEESPEGAVYYIDTEELLTITTNGDMILCRTNAPLVSTCLQLIGQGKKATVRGRDIGKNLRVLIKKTKEKYTLINDLSDLLLYLSTYVREESFKLSAMERHQAIATLNDQKETIYALSTGCDTEDDLYSRMDSIFSDHITPIILSSIHRAKGLEADRVFIIKPELLPHPAAKTPEEIKEENNIKYVAITRAKSSLFFVQDY
jgi:DNA helicase-2/ATP-dependent DNA helicase PcrA